MSTLKRAAILGIVAAAASAGCVRESYVPTITVYTCAAERQQVQTILDDARPALPTILRLPSGERVYIQDNGAVFHYDGPACE